MIKDERVALIAPCGSDCGVCELYLCKDNFPLYNNPLGKGIPSERIPCKGCRAIQGACPVLETKCETWSYVATRGYDFCYQCSDYPCNHLNPAAHRADVLPHNLKVFNLSMIEKQGPGRFIEQSNASRERYYKGKMVVGSGPQI